MSLGAIEDPFKRTLVTLEIEIGGKRLAVNQMLDQRFLDAMPDVMEGVKTDLRTALGLEILKHFPPTLHVLR